MQDYEIRLLCHGRGHTRIEVMHLNDASAIRAAEALAAGRAFEVWRDLECIYGARQSTSPLVHFPAAPLH